MSFLPAISVTALLAIQPLLLFLRRSAVAGVRDFSKACALCAVAVGVMAVATTLHMPFAALLGYAILTLAFFFILRGFRRFLALRIPAWVCPVLAAFAGTTGFITLGGDESLAARVIVLTGLIAAPLLVAGLMMVDRAQERKPVIQAAIIGSALVGCAALAHVLGAASGRSPELWGAPADTTFEYAVAAMKALFLPFLFLAIILAVQNRMMAGLRAAIARDGLTGALSRGALIEAGEQMIADCHARRRPLTFLLLDLDYFKQINDRHGHACGDMALAHFANVVSSFLGGRGVFGRIGGEEFGIVLPHHTEEQATALAEDICRIVRETPAGRGHRRIGLTVSIGIAAAAPGDTITDVMIRADLALYESKADGRDRCSVAKRREIEASTRALAAAAAQLREADAFRQEYARQIA
ncbi:GGDEF domain-containing protein [Bradyrhizobium sp. BRP14]|nr:GGDEF domain-containing protein [Bradyrhizobium sp. BRP14]